MFLKDAPSATGVKALQAAIAGREVVRAADKHLYIVYPDGIGRSRLTNAVIDRKPWHTRYGSQLEHGPEARRPRDGMTGEPCRVRPRVNPRLGNARLNGRTRFGRHAVYPQCRVAA